MDVSREDSREVDREDGSLDREVDREGGWGRPESSEDWPRVQRKVGFG